MQVNDHGEIDISEIATELVNALRARIRETTFIEVGAMNPKFSPEVRALFALIPSTANAYHSGLKGLFEGRMEDAKQLVSKALSLELAEPAELLFVIGEIERAAQYQDNAVRYYEASLKKRPDDPDVLKAKALASWQLGGSRLGIVRMYEKALAVEEEALGKDHYRLLSTLYSLASIHENVRNYEAAEKVLERAVKIGKKWSHHDNSLLTLAINKLGQYYRDAGRLEDAESIFKEALGILGDTTGNAKALVNLSTVYHKRGQFTEAEKCAKEAMAKAEGSADGANQVLIADAAKSLGFIYREAGRYDESESHLKQALEIEDELIGPIHPDIGDTLRALGSLYSFMGRYVDAQLFLERALVAIEGTLGADHPNVGLLLCDLGHVYACLGKRGVAEQVLKRSLRILEAVRGTEDRDRAVVLGNLATLYRDQGKVDEAVQLFEESIAVFERTRGPNHPDVAVPCVNLGNLYLEQHLGKKAKEFYERALLILLNTHGASHPYVAKVLENLRLVND